MLQWQTNLENVNWHRNIFAVVVVVVVVIIVITIIIIIIIIIIVKSNKRKRNFLTITQQPVRSKRENSLINESK